MRWLLRPCREIWSGLERCLASGVRGLVACFLGLAIAWWIYVPVHELLHALGCELGGGRVWRLQVDPLYGGALLSRWFPFVESGGGYAGRLAGFDTSGSDAVHLLTTGLPFSLAILPGVWMMRHGARRRSGLLYGAGLVPAAAPFLSLDGDAYEIGSLLLAQLAPWSSEPARLRLVGDDVSVVWSRLAGAPASMWAGFALAAATGLAWAFAVYGVASAVATRLGEAPLEAATPDDPRSARAIVEHRVAHRP
jgi:hypothetical protein